MKCWGLGLRFQVLGFRALVLVLGFRFQVSGFGVLGFRFGVGVCSGGVHSGSVSSRKGFYGMEEASYDDL